MLSSEYNYYKVDVSFRDPLKKAGGIVKLEVFRRSPFSVVYKVEISNLRVT